MAKAAATASERTVLEVVENLQAILWERIEEGVQKLVKTLVEQSLEGEATQVAGAERHERTLHRRRYRAGHYRRRLLTKHGAIEVRVPRLARERLRFCAFDPASGGPPTGCRRHHRPSVHRRRQYAQAAGHRRGSDGRHRLPQHGECHHQEPGGGAGLLPLQAGAGRHPLPVPGWHHSKGAGAGGGEEGGPLRPWGCGKMVPRTSWASS